MKWIKYWESYQEDTGYEELSSTQYRQFINEYPLVYINQDEHEMIKSILKPGWYSLIEGPTIIAEFEVYKNVTSHIKIVINKHTDDWWSVALSVVTVKDRETFSISCLHYKADEIDGLILLLKNILKDYEMDENI